MKRTLLAAAIAIAATQSARAQEVVQIVEAPLSGLGGDWELGNLGVTADLTATGEGKVLTYAWTDETGLAEVDIQLEIHWRHHRGVPCSVSLNGILIGHLDQPQETLVVQPGVFYPTIHILRIPAGVYAAFGLNTFALTTTDSREGTSVGVCEPPGIPVALRFTIRAVEREEADDKLDPPPVPPIVPQGLVLVDVTTGLIIQPGMIVVSVNVQIMAILAGANSLPVQLEIEVQVVGTPFTGLPTTQSMPVANGGAATVGLPGFSSGERQVRARTVDSKGFASEWVPVDMTFEAAGGATIVRSAAASAAPSPAISLGGSDGGAGGSCSAGAGAGSAALLIGVAALILIGAFRGRIR